ncbi:30S ribosomal protein S7 [bacterium]|nr:30S ribosomal protein S7 [Candidatus Omnitrophota bacterium]MBU4140842.1 30S ribosomal protein S7 [Candidatus Omnitrophota bacterium]MCG2676983.1 30S ribosomal protein S7 [bacterium]
MRRRRAEKRKLTPDLQYNSKVVGQLINMLMLKGKKSVAQSIIYNALEIVKERAGEDNALSVLNKALENVRPLLEVKSRRVGGATYQIPIEVKPERGITLALRWIRDYARARKGKPMQEKLAQEIVDAYKNTGSAVKKKEDTHKMAEANKAFAHYRW